MAVKDVKFERRAYGRAIMHMLPTLRWCMLLLRLETKNSICLLFFRYSNLEDQGTLQINDPPHSEGVLKKR